MLTQICGIPRVGKTALMTRDALIHLKGAQAHRDLIKSRKLLKPLNENGFNYVLPEDHLVFSDYGISTGAHGRIRNYEIDGFHMGLYNDVHPTVFIPPGSNVYLDEAQKYYNSKENAKLADFVSRYYELHGHFRLTITLTMQRPILIDKNIRELVGEVFMFRSLSINNPAAEYSRLSGRA